MSTLRFSVASILGLAASLLCGEGARAEINVGESIDWLVVSRPHVAIGEWTGSAGEAVPPATWVNRTTEVRIVRTLKGEPPERAKFTWHVPADSPAPAAGAEFLLFFSAEKTVEYAVDLAAPATRIHGVAYSTDFRVLKTREAILDAVEARLARLAADPPKADPPGRAANVFTPQRGFLRLEVPEDTEAYASLYSGSACYLVVPADAEHRGPLVEQTRSKEPWERARAASRLASYPGAETEAILGALLADPGAAAIDVWRDGKSVAIPVYPARQAAYESLRALGVEVEKPEGYRDELPASFLR